MSRGESVTPGMRPRLAIGRPSISLMSPVKSIGVAPADVRADGVRVDRRAGLLEVADALRVEAAGHDDLDVLEALLVEPRADLVDEVGRDAAALGGRVEPDAVQPVAERVRDPERLLGLVLERVDEDDPRHVRPEVRSKAIGRLARCRRRSARASGASSRSARGRPDAHRPASTRRRSRRRSPRSRARR